MKPSRELSIIKIEDGVKQTKKDWVVSEYYFRLYVNGNPFAEFLCLPTDLEDLIHGHLYSRGLVSCPDQIRNLSLKDKRAEVVLATFRPTVKAAEAGTFSLRLGDLFKAAAAFAQPSPLFAATGGVHSCALYHREGGQIFREDVGRHNAADKALGRALAEGWNLSSAFMLTSGRVACTLITKAVTIGLPVVVSVGAPTLAAVAAAEAAGVTLCGFARGRRLNIYSAPQRILLE